MVATVNSLAHQNVFPAWRVAEAGVELARDNKAMVDNPDFQGSVATFGLPTMDSYLLPFGAGDLVTILGRPSNGKTLLAMSMLDNKLRGLMASGKPNQIAILISLEVDVEKSAMYQLAKLSGVPITSVLRGTINDYDLGKLDIAAIQLSGMPLFIVGHSTKRNKENRRARPNLNPESIAQAVDLIINEYRTPDNEPLDPTLIVIDYLQRLRPSPSQLKRRMSKFDMAEDNVNWCNDLSQWGGCPVVLCVQAGRQVDGYKVKMPGMTDGQNTSNVEQSSVASFGTYMPKMYGEARTPKFGDLPPIDVTNNLLMVACLKQKMGNTGMVFPLEVNFKTMELTEKDILI